MKEKNTAILKKLFPFIPLKSLFLILLVLSPLSMIISYCQPLVLKAITDEGILRLNVKILVISTGILLGTSLLSQLLDFLQANLFVRVYNETYSRLFQASYRKMLRLKLQYFEEHSQTEIINTMQTDVTSLASVANNTTNILLQTGLRIISGLVGLFFISWPLAVTVLILIPLQWFSSKLLAKRKEKLMEQTLACGREFYAWMGDDVSGMQEIKLWGLAGRKIKQFSKKLLTLLGFSKANTILDAVKSFVDGSFLWITTCLVYLVGGVMVIKKNLTMGDLLAFIQYTGYVISPLTYLFGIKYSFSSIIPSAKRFFGFLDLEEEPSCGKPLSTSAAPFDLDLKNVSFRYPGGDHDVLKNISLQIPHGEKIAIIGKNGSGKSTLLKLLLRFIEPTNGTILLNQTAVCEFEMESYRALFSVVSQTPHLFSGTVIDNISFGSALSPEQISFALHKSGADTFVSQLPLQEHSPIGINGTQLSGGERQKLNVARAFVRNAPIVILDEATSAFDIQSVDYLNTLLHTEFQDQTVIVITHQYELLRHMDHIYELCDGELMPFSS